MNTEPEKDEPETTEEQKQEQDHLSPEPENDSSAQEEETAQEEKGQFALLEAELEQTKDQMLRAMAEADNTRKRLLRERDDIRKYAVSGFARDILDFSDNFRRALDSIPDDMMNDTDERIKNVITGVQTMEKELLKTLEKHNIKKIEPMGEIFNPNFHEAMFEAPGTGQPAGTIIELIEPGYVLHDRLLRPARVGIAKDEGQNTPPESPGGQVDREI